MLRPLCVASCLLAIVIQHGLAWMDEGHMVVAAVAKEVLGAPQAKTFEDILHQWDDEYPGYSTLPMAAIWGDYVKCQFAGEYSCRDLDHFDSISIFNFWHWSPIPYNPRNMSLSAAVFGQDKRNHGACVLSTIERSLKQGNGYTIPQCYGAENPRPINDPKAKFGSFVSWNLQLRLFLHIYGDLHQPCHACWAYSNRLPEGDFGANGVELCQDAKVAALNKKVTLKNLHWFWDTAGGRYPRFYPYLQEEEVTVEAKRLMEKYPKSFFPQLAKGGNLNYYELVEESHEAAKTAVYSELFPTDKVSNRWSGWGDAGSDLIYCPSNDYIKTAVELSQQRIALAGYRLAYELQTFLPYAEQFLKRKLNKKEEASGGHGTALLFALAGVCVVLFAYFVGFENVKRKVLGVVSRESDDARPLSRMPGYTRG